MASNVINDSKFLLAVINIYFLLSSRQHFLSILLKYIYYRFSLEIYLIAAQTGQLVGDKNLTGQHAEKAHAFGPRCPRESYAVYLLINSAITL